MTIPTKHLPRTTISSVALALLLGGFGMATAMAKPAELAAPAQISCIELPAALSGIETKGLFKVESETRLERGPYISVHEDAEGIYYRAPPGGVYIGPPKNKPANGAWQVNRDGGIFVPRDASLPPQLYSYVSDSGTSAATVVPPAGANCSTMSFARDPATGGISVASYGGPAESEAAAKVVGVAGPGILGFALNAMLSDRGKIAKLPQSKNPEFNAKLNELVRKAVPIKPAGAPD
jgi:hypothetical protein